MKKISGLAFCFGVCSLFIAGLGNATTTQSTLGEYNQLRAQMNLAPIAGNPNTPLLCDVRKNQNGSVNVNCSIIQQRQYQPPQEYQNPNSQIVPLPWIDPSQPSYQYQPPNEQIVPLPKWGASQQEWDNFDRNDRLQKRIEANRERSQELQDRRNEAAQEVEHQRQLRHIERIFK